MDQQEPAPEPKPKRIGPKRRYKINLKQRAFVREYLKDCNATQAAIRAGYKKKNADVVGPRLLGQVGITALVEAGFKKAADRVNVDLGEFLENAKELAFAKGKRDPARAQGLIILGRYKKWLTDRVEHTGANGGAIPIQIVLPSKND